MSSDHLPSHAASDRSPADAACDRAFVECLLRWFQSARRSLPWRHLKSQLIAQNAVADVDPEPGHASLLSLDARQKIAYATWVSEVMSQQTTLAVVVPRFEQFVRTLPDLAALAQCPEPVLRTLWSGLGYYARARNLQKGAQFIEKEWRGLFPSTYEEWLRVPGCGPYTAAMIASVVGNEQVAAVDGNVSRVVSRILCVGRETWSTAGQTRIRDFAMHHVRSTQHPGDFNQALMELGALICRKQTPRCQECPVNAHCEAFRKGETALHPPAKPRREQVRIALACLVFVCPSRGEVALVRRSGGFLANTHGFPLLPLERLGQNAPRGTPGAAFSHTITHHKLAVTPVGVVVANQDALTAHPLFLAANENPHSSDVHWISVSGVEAALGTSLDRKAWKGVKALT